MSMYQVPFIAAANVPTPPSGEVVFFFDLSNSNRMSRKDSSGAVVDLQSGASYTDSEAIAAVQNAITAATSLNARDLSPDDEIYIRDVSVPDFKKLKRKLLSKLDVERFWTVGTDFVGASTGDFTAFVSGTGASNQAGTYGQDLVERAIGVLQSDTGTTATGRASLGLVSGLLFRATNARYKYVGRHAIEAVSTLTETFIMRIGLGDFYTGAGEGTNGLYFRYTDLQNGGRWEAVSRVAGVDLTAVDTGIAPDLDYHIFDVELSEDGQQAVFRIDNNIVATINAPLLPGGGNAFGAGFKIEKTVGTGQRNMNTDWMLVEIERSSAR